MDAAQQRKLRGRLLDVLPDREGRLVRPPQGPVLPPLRCVAVWIEGVPAVKDAPVPDPRTEAVRIRLAEFFPLGEQGHHVSLVCRLGQRADVVQVRIEAVGIGVRLRIINRDHGALHVEQPGNVEGRGVPDVVGVGFECRTERGHAHAGQVSAGQFPDQVNGADTAAVVDGIDFAEEPDGLAHPELLGAVFEGPDVLGQAAAAEAQPRLEEPPADA